MTGKISGLELTLALPLTSHHLQHNGLLLRNQQR